MSDIGNPTPTRRIRSALLCAWILTTLSFVPAEARRDVLSTPPGSRDVSASPVDLEEAEVSFQNGADRLAGTLFSPTGRATHPAVVLLAGSDRSARGPLRIRIARHFAAQSIAALVYDSPGTGASTGNTRLQNREDRAIEALSAIRYLRGRSDVDARYVGIFGGSEGADVALLAAARDAKVSFVIAVSAAVGASIFDVMAYSAEKRGHRLGLSSDDIAKANTFKEIAYAFLTGLDIVEWSLLEARVSRWPDDPWPELIELAREKREMLTPQEKEGLLVSLREVVTHFGAQPWFATIEGGKDFERLTLLGGAQFFAFVESAALAEDWDRNMRCEIQAVECPVLAIWGEEDSFLPPRRSAAMLEKLLTDTRHGDFSIRIFENASHFLTESSPTDPLVPGYLETMSDWLQDRVRGE